DRVILAPRGRALQMNAGAEKASGDVLLFLHADTRLPADADLVMLNGLERSGRSWGRFDVKIEGRSPLLPVLAWLMNIRSRLTGLSTRAQTIFVWRGSGIATGDEAIFVRRAAFQATGGFPAIPLMEDIALCKRLKREPATVPARARHHLRSALGKEWRAQDNGPDVAVAARLFLRCRSEKARAAIRL